MLTTVSKIRRSSSEGKTVYQPVNSLGRTDDPSPATARYILAICEAGTYGHEARSIRFLRTPIHAWRQP